MQKYFYFRTDAAVADDDTIAGSVMCKVEDLVAMYPTSDTALTLTFTPLLRHQSDDAGAINKDTIILNVAANTHREVMTEIARTVNASGPAYGDGVITVADDAADDDNAAAVYIHPSITSCGAIAIAAVYA